jgi:hypothetical protein
MKTIVIAAILLIGAGAAESPKKLGEQVGQGCVGKDVFDMQATNSVTGVFSVRCEDGREFLLLIHQDGTTTAIPCGQATARCFKTYKEQEGA